MSDAKKRPTVLLVFKYRAQGATKKMLNVFNRVMPDGTLGDERCYGRARTGLLGRATSGCVYEVDTDDPNGSTIYTGSAGFVEHWHDADKCTEWAAADAVERAEERTRQRIKKAHSIDAFADALEPIREAYWNMRGPQRAQLLALVVKHITTQVRR